MKSIVSALKKYKPAHWLYNLLHYKSLLHNKRAFQKYNIHKPLFASISSNDFPDKTSRAWLDAGNSKQLAPQHPQFSTFSPSVQEQILNWSDNGFMILHHFFDDDIVDSVNKEIDGIVEKQLIAFTHDNKLPFANRISSLIKGVTYTPQLISILNFLLGKEVVPF